MSERRLPTVSASCKQRIQKVGFACAHSVVDCGWGLVSSLYMKTSGRARFWFSPITFFFPPLS